MTLDAPGEIDVQSDRSRGKSLTERAYDVLRRKIITGEMRPGHEMSESELAEQLSVSKTPVREALARLAVEGLVEAFPRRGYRVTPVTIKNMNDLFTLRALLEGAAGAMAATKLTEDELDALDKLANASYVLGETASMQIFVRANENFHSAIARASGNPRLHALVMSHLEECARFFYMGAQSRDVNPETSNDHHRIVEVLRERDPEKARAALIEHNENTRRGLLTSLVGEGRGDLAI
ncbi:GntR family transcriptional regulator [Terrarubrum flagellatum]|uniref:GntR family transcriptional regulator n=1 Tax=Terrirubrum flagellatum TaxID=2895980 RepID=UPI0031452463